MVRFWICFYCQASKEPGMLVNFGAGLFHGELLTQGTIVDFVRSYINDPAAQVIAFEVPEYPKGMVTTGWLGRDAYPDKLPENTYAIDGFMRAVTGDETDDSFVDELGDCAHDWMYGHFDGEIGMIAACRNCGRKMFG